MRASGGRRRSIGSGCASRPAADGDAGPLLAAAFPDRIAQRRGEPGSFRLSGGGGRQAAVGDPLARARCWWWPAGAEGAAPIRLAAALDPERLPPSLAARVTETVESGFDPVTGAVLSRAPPAARHAGAGGPDRAGRPADAAAALAAGERQLPWTDAARQLQARVG